MLSRENIQMMLLAIEKSFKQQRSFILQGAGNTAFKEKVDGSPFTKTDIAVEKSVKADLSKVCGEIPVFGEENGYDEDNLPETVWLIDPIDGTKSFISGEPYFTNMAVLIHREEAIACCIYNPTTDDVFTAIKGNGAYKNGQRLNLASVVVPETVYCKGRFIDPLLNILGNDISPQVPPEGGGSSFCMVADGQAAARFQILGPGQLHDYATGALLVREAGGELIDFSNEDYSIHSKSFVACHPAIAGRIWEHLVEIRELEKLQSK